MEVESFTTTMPHDEMFLLGSMNSGYLLRIIAEDLPAMAPACKQILSQVYCRKGKDRT